MAELDDTVFAIRRILRDEPVKVQLQDAIGDVNSEEITLVSGDVARVAVGNRLEHDDSTGEQRRVLSRDESLGTIEAERGYLGSVPSNHDIDTYMLVNPRFPHDVVVQGINYVIDAELYGEGVYREGVHTIVSSLTTDEYEVPAATVEEIMAVYQKPAGDTKVTYLADYSAYPTKVSTALYTNGAVFYIYENVGTPGTDPYYVNTKERHTLSTCSGRVARIVELLAASHVLDWEGASRLAGPTNQGDRTVAPLDHPRMASQLREQANRMIRAERANLRSFQPAGRNFIY